MTRRRLDAELVRRGLVGGPDDARNAVAAGLVTVAGRPADNAARLVSDAEPIAVAGPGRRFASRGGEKLDAALERFAVDPAGRDCLDAGASTGGFTDVLLRRGASRVCAVDVGYGQLAWSLRNDPRVSVLDRTNVRTLAPQTLPFTPSLVVADLSFIPLVDVVPALVSLGSEDADLVLLVKPQFESAPADVGRGGVVRDPATWRRAVRVVADACDAHGAPPQDVMASPLPGPAGNVEFLLHARRGGVRRDVDMDIDGAIEAAVRIGGAA